MKKVLIKILLTVCLFTCFTKAQAQIDTAFLNTEIDIDELLPPLDSLYAIALYHNPLQKLEQAQAEAYKWNLDYVRKVWTQGMRVFFNYAIGDQAISFNNQGSGTTGTGVTSGLQLQASSGYRGGFDLQLSLFDWLGQRGKVKQAKAQWEVAKHKKDVEAMNTKKVIADMYTNMVGWQKVYKARNEDLITQQIACQISEKELREGTIHFSEYARLKNIYAIAISAYEDSKKYYINFYEQLQVLVGVKLSTLKRTKR